ncbi:MAG: helix-turn-helix transcriptional regulator [Prevotella sp.]|nr:helix-turn-helix transcriptional regulator [Prevotella sp.]
MVTNIEYFYGLTLFGLILSCLFVAAVRWFHVCPPYKNNVKYYYPARTMVTLSFLSDAVLLPFVLNPLEPRAWLFTKTFIWVMLPLYGAQMSFCYFGTIRQWAGWKMPGRIIQTIVTVAMLVFWIWALWPGVNVNPDIIQSLKYVIIPTGFVCFVYCGWMWYWIYKQLKSTDEESFSNPEDFPSRLAVQALVLTMVMLVAVLPSVIIDSPVLMSLTFLVFMVFSIYLLIIILHPHRRPRQTDDADCEAVSRKKEDDATRCEADNFPIDAMLSEPNEPDERQMASEDNADDDKTHLSEEKITSIKEEIKHYVEDERQYLNQHLTMKEVAEHCSYGRTYVSFVFKNELDGFFNYVNRLRLAHADSYRMDHRLAGQEEIALASGFTSRQSYYSVRRRMGWK